MKNDWFEFQERIKQIYYKLGCDAETNVKLKGVRTFHDVDILVRSKFLGNNIRWIVEAKYWKRKISKLHVLALRQIVDDTGCDRGFIISNAGFQKGAIEAAQTSNVVLMTFDELELISNAVFHFDILKTFYRRINYISCRYYAHSKSTRIEYGLRQEVYNPTGEFDAYFILHTIAYAIKQGLKNEYPILLNTYLNEQYGDSSADNFYQLINWLNLNLVVLEEKILKAEIEMQKAGDYFPVLNFKDEDENIHIETFKGMFK